MPAAVAVYQERLYAVQTATPNQCVLASIDMAKVRAYLGISADGHLALIAMALLLGGDYHMRGAERIGPKQVCASIYSRAIHYEFGMLC